MTFVTKNRRKFYPRGFFTVLILAMFFSGCAVGLLDTEPGWTLRTWIALGLVSPFVLVVLALVGSGLYYLSTTSEDDE